MKPIYSFAYKINLIARVHIPPIAEPCLFKYPASPAKYWQLHVNATKIIVECLGWKFPFTKLKTPTTIYFIIVHSSPLSSKICLFKNQRTIPHENPRPRFLDRIARRKITTANSSHCRWPYEQSGRRVRTSTTNASQHIHSLPRVNICLLEWQG